MRSIIWFRRCRYVTVIRRTASNCDSPINSTAVRRRLSFSRPVNNNSMDLESPAKPHFSFVFSSIKRDKCSVSQNIDWSVDPATTAHWISITIQSWHPHETQKSRKIFARSVGQVARVSSIHLLPTEFHQHLISMSSSFSECTIFGRSYNVRISDDMDLSKSRNRTRLNNNIARNRESYLRWDHHEMYEFILPNEIEKQSESVWRLICTDMATHTKERFALIKTAGRRRRERVARHSFTILIQLIRFARVVIWRRQPLNRWLWPRPRSVSRKMMIISYAESKTDAFAKSCQILLVFLGDSIIFN